MFRRAIICIGFAVGAIAAAVVAVSGAPSSNATPVPATKPLDAFITAAMSDYELNNDNADSAPKQQVVNGWVAKDLLQIIALQNEASAATLDGIADAAVAKPAVDGRPMWLLVILVLVLCWMGFWTFVPGVGRPPASSTSHDSRTSGAPSPAGSAGGEGVAPTPIGGTTLAPAAPSSA